MTLRRLVSFAALGLVVGLGTGCDLRPESAAGSPATSQPPGTTQDEGGWHEVTDEATGISFQLPYRPVVAGEARFRFGGARLVGTRQRVAYGEGSPRGGVSILVTPFAVKGHGIVEGRRLLNANIAWLRAPSSDGVNQGAHRLRVFDVEATQLLGHDATMARVSFVNHQRNGRVYWRYGVVTAPDWVVEVLVTSVDAKQGTRSMGYADEIFSVVIGSLQAPDDGGGA